MSGDVKQPDDPSSVDSPCSPLMLTVEEWHKIVCLLNERVIELQKHEESEGRLWDQASMEAKYPGTMRLMKKLLYEWIKPAEG